jgi:BASS family bile acid:Na+ symporter
MSREAGDTLPRGEAVAAARWLESRLLPLLVAVVLFSLAVPGWAWPLRGWVLPIFALMMLAVSLTFDLRAVQSALKARRALALSLPAVFLPLAAAGYAAGRAAFGPGPLAVGLALLGALPTDISAPLFTALGRGNTALAAVMNALNTSLSPVVMPLVVVGLTGLPVAVPLAQLVGELLVAVVVPTALGTFVRTALPGVQEREAVARGAAVLLYVGLVGVVVSTDARALLSLGRLLVPLALVVLGLNLGGYALGLAVWRLAGGGRAEAVAHLFVMGEKEFSVGAAVVFAGGLDRAILLPSLVAAVVQRLTAAALAQRLGRG